MNGVAVFAQPPIRGWPDVEAGIEINRRAAFFKLRPDQLPPPKDHIKTVGLADEDAGERADGEAFGGWFFPPLPKIRSDAGLFDMGGNPDHAAPFDDDLRKFGTRVFCSGRRG